MELRETVDAAYAMDGGTVAIHFIDDDGQGRGLMAVQDVIPIDPRRETNPHWRNGAILLDDRPVTDPDQLIQLREGLRACAARLSPGSERMPLPENTLLVGDDLKDYLSRDQVGREQWLLLEAASRIDAALQRSAD